MTKREVELRICSRLINIIQNDSRGIGIKIAFPAVDFMWKGEDKRLKFKDPSFAANSIIISGFNTIYYRSLLFLTIALVLWSAVFSEECIFCGPTLVDSQFKGFTETRYKFLSAHEGDKQQLQWFYNACRGIRQNTVITPVAPTGAAPTPNSTHLSSHPPATSVPAHSPLSEDVQLAMAIDASIQSAMAEGFPVPVPPQGTASSVTNGWDSSSENTTHNDWGQSSGAPPPSKPKPTSDPYNGWSGVRPSSSSPQLHTSKLATPTINPLAHEAPPTVSVPSAPPIVEETFYGPVQYPTIDSSPVDLTVPASGNKNNETGGSKEGSSSSSGDCVICLDAPVEGACIPCGHMAGCMSCLNEIKGKNWGCPVCRAKIDQVVRLYAVSG